MFGDVIKSYRAFLIEELSQEAPGALLNPPYEVLTQREYKKITDFNLRENRISSLLDIVENKKKEQQESFLKYVGDWYRWIYKESQEKLEISVKKKKLETTLNEGGVPPLPLRHVARKEECIELFKMLRELKRNVYVVVHGMRGCGKSTLVSSVFYEYESLIWNAFEGKVFWVSIGHEAEELTVQLDLCGRLISYHTIQPLPLDSKSAKRYLKDKFNREDYFESLLILDDVPSASFINALDVGCKILVTTDDINVMNECKKQFHPIRVSPGFTEEQSLKLFAESIECEKSKLPVNAKNIHSICKGFPAIISLVSSQLAEHKEEVTANIDRWMTYEAKLKQEGIQAAIGPYDRYRSEQVAVFYRAMRMTIDSLDEELRSMYCEFALFMEDVNIRPEVLCILWNKSKIDVISIMNEFEKKFLVRKMWHSSQRTYVYCVHDLHLGYLKTLFTDIERKQLHKKLINCYRQKYNHDLNNFPVDDNYILLYIGYHLKEAGMIEEFPDIYLNLIFIERKIVYYGAADLLFDFKKYKKEIAHDEANSKKYEDFTHFIRRIAASCRPISNSNLIQFALCEYKDSAVYRAALKLKNLPHRFKYFEMLTLPPVENSPPSVYADRDEIVRAAFTHCGDILVANANGIIRRMNLRENNLSSTKTFEGHTARVNILQVKNFCHFLSASDDSTVRVWDANGSGSGDFANRRTPSPQIKQDGWLDPWPKIRLTGDRAVAVLEHGVPVKCAQFSNNPTNLNIVSVDVNGQLRVFFSAITNDGNEIELTYQEAMIYDTKKKDIISCSFSNDEKKVLYSCTSGDIHILDSPNGEHPYQLNLENCSVKSLIIIPETQQINAIILGASEFYVGQIEPTGNDQGFELNAVKSASSYGRKRKHQYVCAACSSDGRFLAIATTNYYIFIYDTRSGEELLKFSESNGKIANISWSQKNQYLLTTYENSKIMKTWIVQQDGILNNAIKLRQHAFDAAWFFSDDIGEVVCVAVALDNQNNINILEYNLDTVDQRPKVIPTTERILQVAVCPLDGNIVYAQEGGEIHLLDYNYNFDDRRILTCPRYHLVNLKVFGMSDDLQSKTVVVVAGEDTIDEFGLIAWNRCVTKLGEVIEAEVVFNPLPQTVIRDMIADIKNNALYVVTIDHVFRIYDLSTGTLKRIEDWSSYTLDVSFENNLKYCDVSGDFQYIVTGNEKQRFLRAISENAEYKEWTTDIPMKTCKLSPDAKYLVVGFDNSDIEIFNIEDLPNVRPIKVEHPYKVPPGTTLDITWSPSSDRFIVIFDREVSLYRMLEDGAEVYANIYISVDKFISNDSFNKSATVDSSGHFHIFKHPF